MLLSGAFGSSQTGFPDSEGLQAPNDDGARSLIHLAVKGWRSAAGAVVDVLQVVLPSDMGLVRLPTGQYRVDTAGAPPTVGPPLALSVLIVLASLAVAVHDLEQGIMTLHSPGQKRPVLSKAWMPQRSVERSKHRTQEKHTGRTR